MFLARREARQHHISNLTLLVFLLVLLPPGPFPIVALVESKVAHVVVESRLPLVATKPAHDTDHVLLEPGPRERSHDLLVLVDRDRVAWQRDVGTEEITHDAQLPEEDFGLLVVRDGRRGVERDRVPHQLKAVFIPAAVVVVVALGLDQRAREVGPVHFEPLVRRQQRLGRRPAQIVHDHREDHRLEIQFWCRRHQRWELANDDQCERRATETVVQRRQTGVFLGVLICLVDERVEGEGDFRHREIGKWRARHCFWADADSTSI